MPSLYFADVKDRNLVFTPFSHCHCNQQQIDAPCQVFHHECDKARWFFLERFPPDIWAYFAWYLPGEQLGRLMMTGATILWRRLKSPKVVKSIKLGKDFIVFRSWPQFLNELPSLEEVSIRSPSLPWSRFFGLRINLIPSGVRKLELTGSWSNSSTKRIMLGKPGATLNLDKHLPHLETLIFDLSKVPDLSWMTHSPQSLTTMSLDSWDGAVELPSTLIHFSVYQVAVSRPSFVSKLPLSLESFVVNFEVDGVDLVLPLLPPSSRKLHLGDQVIYSSGQTTSQALLEQLPTSLTSLQVPDLEFQKPPALCSPLPSKLTKLKTSGFPCSAWPLLPQTLTTLWMTPFGGMTPLISKIADADGVAHKVESIPFESLPKSITKLNLESHEKYFCGPPATFVCSFFPPQLSYLSFSSVQLSPATAKLLPSSLTYLEIGNFCERVCEHLPAGLKTLISSRTLMSPNLSKFLPKSLTSLQLSMPDSDTRWFDDPWFDYNTGESMNRSSKLSMYSIHDNCVSVGFNWKDSSPLPRTLTHLDLRQAVKLGDSFMIHQHLPNLLNLSLVDSQHFTGVSIPLLSPHLTSLNLQSSTKVSGNSFQFLPRHLTDLNMASSEAIIDSDIHHLPRTLKVVSLNHGIHLTEFCIADLPPHLVELNLEMNSQISPRSFPNFPYSLRSSQINQSAIFSEWFIYYGKIHKRQTNTVIGA